MLVPDEDYSTKTPCALNKRQGTRKGQSKMDNHKKLSRYDAQNEEKRKENKTLYVLDTTIYK